MNFTNEQMNKAKTAKTAEELLEMAKESGIAMTEEEAEKYFAELNKEGELNDSELASVAGGKGRPDPKYYIGQMLYSNLTGEPARIAICKYNETKEQYVYKLGHPESDGSWYISLANVGEDYISERFHT